MKKNWRYQNILIRIAKIKKNNNKKQQYQYTNENMKHWELSYIVSEDAKWYSYLEKNFQVFFFSLFISRERRRKEEWGRGRKRGRDRIPSRLCTISSEPHAGLYPTNCEIMTWAKIKSWTLNWLSHPATPQVFYIVKYTFTLWPRNPPLSIWNNRNLHSHKNLYINVYSSLIHNCQKTENNSNVLQQMNGR